MSTGVLLIAVIIGLLRGGSLLNLGRLEIRYIYLILGAYLLQAGLDFFASRYHLGGYVYLHIFTYLLLFFAIWQNRHLPGMYLILTGTLFNFVVIALNHGQMPVRADVLPVDVAAALAAGTNGTHRLMTADTRLAFLADTWYMSTPLFKQLISLGDIIIDLGLAVLVVFGMQCKALRDRSV